MPDFSIVQAFPDVDFVDTSVNDLLAAGVTAYQDAYYKLTGKQITLQPGDDFYIMLYANALREYGVLQQINYAARQNLLKYAAGNNLDNLAANSGNTRDGAEYAVDREQFLLGVALSQDLTIPQGTRVTPGNNLYFATDEDVTITAGSLSATVPITCLTAGATGNGYVPGQISTLVDTTGLGFIAAVTNLDGSDGGTDIETDLSLDQKIFSGNAGFSVAGPSAAYDYFARKFSSAVIDTQPLTLSDGCVTLYVLLTGGTLPNETFLSNLAAYVGADNRRPMTDKFAAAAPEVVNYDVTLTWYIDAENAAQAGTTAAAVTAAVSAFTSWTASKIKRDVIPDKLTSLLQAAGAKRAVISSPAYTAVPDASVAIARTISVAYGGIDNG